jgi:hypothetical protein
MKVGFRPAFHGATVIALVCLLGAVRIAGQAPAVQSPPERVPITDDVFKSVELLRGIPVDTFFESMGMFANAMGNDCTYCHAPKAYFDKAAFAEPTPRIRRARQMITMMNSINEQFFGGRTRVTCFTCHGGSSSPKSEPDLTLQYAEPTEDPNVIDFAVDARFTASQVFDKYLQALGGAERLARFTSYAAKGTYKGFDTGEREVPVDIFGSAPARQSMIVHQFNGDSVRTFDGRNGWMAGPDTPLPLVTLTGGNLDRARLEAVLSFPTGIREAFPQWKVGRTAIDDREVQIVQGSIGGRAGANFYFDEAGLLVRFVRWTQTPVGFVPTQIDFADYRDVAGVKFPFRRVVSQTYMRMTVALSEVQPNVQIDAGRFARPTPVQRPAP